MEKIQTLKEILSNKNISPIQRVINFKAQLSSFKDELSISTASSWPKFVKTCLMVIAIILTGVIPGLLALYAYTKATNQPLMFFAQTGGDRYVHRMQQELDRAHNQIPFRA